MLEGPPLQIDFAILFCYGFQDNIGIACLNNINFVLKTLHHPPDLVCGTLWSFRLSPQVTFARVCEEKKETCGLHGNLHLVWVLCTHNTYRSTPLLNLWKNIVPMLFSLSSMASKTKDLSQCKACEFIWKKLRFVKWFVYIIFYSSYFGIFILGLKTSTCAPKRNSCKVKYPTESVI